MLRWLSSAITRFFDPPRALAIATARARAATPVTGGLVLGLDDQAAALLRGPYEHLRDTRTPPDLELAELRGNVPTRVRKLDDGEYAAAKAKVINA